MKEQDTVYVQAGDWAQPQYNGMAPLTASTVREAISKFPESLERNAIEDGIMALFSRFAQPEQVHVAEKPQGISRV